MFSANIVQVEVIIFSRRRDWVTRESTYRNSKVILPNRIK